MDVQDLVARRLQHPQAIAEAAADRRVADLHAVAATRPLLIVAADHPARGALGVGRDPLAMADRSQLLARLMTALSHPRADGVLGTPDIIEDLLLLGVLDDKIVIGSMNRSGLAGSTWELDDRFTAYDAPTIEAMRLDAGKMLLRLDLADRDSNPTIVSCARAVSDLAARQRIALVEPLPMRRTEAGTLQLSTDVRDLVRAVSVASGLGATSAFTWLKLPVTDDVEQVLAASMLPSLLLGGEPGDDPDRVFDGWRRALTVPGATGLVPGRALLYPRDGDVEAAVERAARIVDGS